MIRGLGIIVVHEASNQKSQYLLSIVRSGQSQRISILSLLKLLSSISYIFVQSQRRSKIIKVLVRCKINIASDFRLFFLQELKLLNYFTSWLRNLVYHLKD